MVGGKACFKHFLMFVYFHLFERQNDRDTERQRLREKSPPAGSLSNCPKERGMGQAKDRSMERHLNL